MLTFKQFLNEFKFDSRFRTVDLDEYEIVGSAINQTFPKETITAVGVNTKTGIIHISTISGHKLTLNGNVLKCSTHDKTFKIDIKKKQKFSFKKMFKSLPNPGKALKSLTSVRH